MTTKKNDLDALKKLEDEQKGIEQESTLKITEDNNLSTEKTSMLDGYKVIDRYDLPQHGDLYPESWEFAYRCPTSKEVANSSTLNEQDQPAIIVAIEDLIRRCVVIFDTEKNRQVSAGEINDSHRTFFLLLIRDFYLPGNPIGYDSACSLCHEQMTNVLAASSLKYHELNEKLLGAFDGRRFILEGMIEDPDEEPIEFLIPTIELSSRIFKYIVRVYRENSNDREKKEDKIVFDKQFLLFAPYLYVTGKETIKELIQKYKALQKNEDRFKAYLEIISKLKLDNEDNIDTTCPHCRSEEVADIRFPGGWKGFFVSKKSTAGYFD